MTECDTCGKGFQITPYTSSSKCTYPQCATCRKATKDAERVAPGAKEGETVEEYLDRIDRERWNIRTGEKWGGSLPTTETER